MRRPLEGRPEAAFRSRPRLIERNGRLPRPPPPPASPARLPRPPRRPRNGARQASRPNYIRANAANNNPLRLEARSETDGSLLWSWVPPASGDVGFKSEVLLTKNLAFVSTNLSTYAIDLATHKPVWSYPVIGNLALSSNGVLYLEGINTLTAVNAK
jgi:hypothetical protein